MDSTPATPSRQATGPRAGLYPKRRSHFAHRYTRLLTKTCAAQEIGHISFVLCVTIAHLEDAKHYCGAITFFNEQLIPLIGVSKWEALDAARKRAVQAGWLHYIPGNRGQRQPGRYWVTVPSHLDDIDDAPFDESQYPANGDREGDWTGTQYPAKGDREGDWTGTQYPAKGDREGERQGDREGEHSYPVPNPIIKTVRKRTSCVKPSIKEVKAYWEQEKLNGDPEAFCDHYDANGWVQGRQGKPIKDWQAAARNWSRNALTFDRTSAPAASEPDLPFFGGRENA